MDFNSRNKLGIKIGEVFNKNISALNYRYIGVKDFRGLFNTTINENSRQISEDLKKKIDMCWSEVRTANDKYQSNFITRDYIPIALLPHKRIFHGKRESDIIMAWYNPYGKLLNKRRKNVKIIHEIVPYYNLISDFLYEPLNTPEIETWDGYEVKFHTNISIEIKKMKYNYLEVKLELNRDNWMKFKINQEVNTAKDLIYSVDGRDIKSFNSLLYVLNSIFDDELEYIEIWISAYNIEHQKSCISLGFIPTGYFPAVKKINNSDLREDRIIFVKSKSYPHYSGKNNNLKLIDRTKSLFNIFKDQICKIKDNR